LLSTIKNHMRNLPLIHKNPGIIVYLFAGFSWYVLAAQPTQQPSFFDQLGGTEVREISLRTDLASLIDHRNTDSAEQDAEFCIMTDNGKQVDRSYQIKVSARGKYRRRICDFPPIKLDFSKADLRKQGLSDFDDFKLVTHCKEDKSAGNDNLLREYLIYQLYRQLTNYSYRIQLVRIQYIDTKGQVSPLRRYGFIIEDTAELADRLGATVCDTCLNPHPSRVDMQAENMHALFQYFISNTDFSLPMLRNLKLLAVTDSTLIPVAFDFDFSGMVNAGYAIPNLQMGQLSLQHRIFLGLPASNEVIEANLAVFRQKREALLSTIDQCKLLDREARDEMILFLEQFYNHIDQLSQDPEPSWYHRLRKQAPNVVPSGGSPEHYLISK
jgi:hypothetical protein